jgi:hypothetical protein
MQKQGDEWRALLRSLAKFGLQTGDRINFEDFGGIEVAIKVASIQKTIHSNRRKGGNVITKYTIFNKYKGDYSGLAENLLRTLLNVSAILSIVFGILIIAYSLFILRPRLVSAMSSMEQRLSSADEAVDHVSTLIYQGNDLFTAAGSTVERGTKVVQLFPEILTALQGTLFEASHTLEAAGRTARQSTKGLTGLVVPKGALEIDNAFLQNTAVQLRLLGRMIDELQSDFAALSTSTTQLSNEILNPKSMRDPFLQVLRVARADIHSIRRAISTTSIPFYGTLLGVSLGGLCIILGLFAGMLALICTYAGRLDANQKALREKLQGTRPQRPSNSDLSVA